MSIIESLLDRPYIIIGGLLLLFAVILYFQLLDANGYIGFIALVVGVSTVLYARKSMILQVRMEHTKDLHEFLKEWLVLLESRQTKLIYLLPTFRMPFWQKNSYTEEYGLYPITQGGLYEDLLNNHVPEEHKNFHNAWSKYKKSTEAYEDSCGLLYGMLVEEIDKSFQDIGIAMSENYEVDKFSVNVNYAKFVYVSYVSKVVGNDYLKDPKFTITPYTVQDKVLHKLSGFPEGQEYQIANGTEQQMKKLEQRIKDDIENAVKKYRKNLKDYTIAIESNIKNGHLDQEILYGDCRKILRELLNYPVLSGTSCYILNKI